MGTTFKKFAVEPPSLHLTLSRKAYSKFKWANQRAKGNEVAVLGIGSKDDPLYIEDIVIPKQKVSTASANMDPDWYNLFITRYILNGEADRVRTWMHTHPGFSPCPSGTDEDSFLHLSADPDWFFMAIVNFKEDEYYARLRIANSRYPHMALIYEPEIHTEGYLKDTDFAAMVGAWEEEFTAMVSNFKSEPVIVSSGPKTSSTPPLLQRIPEEDDDDKTTPRQRATKKELSAPSDPTNTNALQGYIQYLNEAAFREHGYGYLLNSTAIRQLPKKLRGAFIPGDIDPDRVTEDINISIPKKGGANTLNDGTDYYGVLCTIRGETMLLIDNYLVTLDHVSVHKPTDIIISSAFGEWKIDPTHFSRHHAFLISDGFRARLERMAAKNDLDALEAKVASKDAATPLQLVS